MALKMISNLTYMHKHTYNWTNVARGLKLYTIYIVLFQKKTTCVYVTTHVYWCFIYKSSKTREMAELSSFSGAYFWALLHRLPSSMFRIFHIIFHSHFYPFLYFYVIEKTHCWKFYSRFFLPHLSHCPTIESNSFFFRSLFRYSTKAIVLTFT